jgi:hypothetical protein
MLMNPIEAKKPGSPESITFTHLVTLPPGTSDLQFNAALAIVGSHVRKNNEVFMFIGDPITPDHPQTNMQIKKIQKQDIAIAAAYSVQLRHRQIVLIDNTTTDHPLNSYIHNAHRNKHSVYFEKTDQKMPVASKPFEGRKSRKIPLDMYVYNGKKIIDLPPESRETIFIEKLPDETDRLIIGLVFQQIMLTKISEITQIKRGSLSYRIGKILEKLS